MVLFVFVLTGQLGISIVEYNVKGCAEPLQVTLLGNKGQFTSCRLARKRVKESRVDGSTSIYSQYSISYKRLQGRMARAYV